MHARVHTHTPTRIWSSLEVHLFIWQPWIRYWWETALRYQALYEPIFTFGCRQRSHIWACYLFSRWPALKPVQASSKENIVFKLAHYVPVGAGRVESCSYDGAWYIEYNGATFVRVSQILMERSNFSSTTVTFDKLCGKIRATDDMIPTKCSKTQPNYLILLTVPAIVNSHLQSNVSAWYC